MAETTGCPCSNVTIMQLFHELKQKFPTVPDQIVSKVINQNAHDKKACVTILQRESRNFVQSYPGALISGVNRNTNIQQTLCDRCPVINDDVITAQQQQQHHHHPHITDTSPNCDFFKNKLTSDETDLLNKMTFSNNIQQHMINNTKELHSKSTKQLIKEEKSFGSKRKINNNNNKKEEDDGDGDESCSNSTVGSIDDKKSISSIDTLLVNVGTSDEDGTDNKEVVLVNSNINRSQSSDTLLFKPVTRSLSIEDNGRLCNINSTSLTKIDNPINDDAQSSSNYQVNVRCKVETIASLWPPLKRPVSSELPPRPFTSVNLTLRPPSSEPQLPIDIHSGQSLTYSTYTCDPKLGYQSHLQIKIGPELIEKQKERKDLLSKELQHEKEKLRNMQLEVQSMQAALTRQPSPSLLPKLKAEISRLRIECERLTAAVDLYSDSQHVLPLGETRSVGGGNGGSGSGGSSVGGDNSWSCHVCTFRNHPLLAVCEECEMPRLSEGSATLSALVPATLPACVPAMPSASVLSNLYNNRTILGAEGHSHTCHPSLPPIKNCEQLGGMN